MSSEIPTKPPIDTSLSFDEAVKTQEYRWECERLFSRSTTWPNLLLTGSFVVIGLSSWYGPRLMAWLASIYGFSAPPKQHILFIQVPAIWVLGATSYFIRRAHGRRRWQVLYNLGYPICPHCGYDVRGQIEPRCSECGTAIVPPPSPDPKNDRLRDAIKTTQGNLELRRLFQARRWRVSRFSFLCFLAIVLLNAIVFTLSPKPFSFLPRHAGIYVFWGTFPIVMLAIGLSQRRHWRQCRWQALHNLGFEVCTNCGYDLRSCIDELRQQPEPCCPKCKISFMFR